MIRVVIADDQPVIRTGFSVIAESAGDIEVVRQAGSGPEAVELVRTLAPDVVLMDVRMPDGDGLTATAQLQDTDTAVVIVTTFDLDDYVFGALDAGAVGFLLKNADADDLIEAIRAAARGEGLVGPEVTRRIAAEFARRRPHPASGGSGDGRTQLPGPEVLSEREREIVTALAEGLSNAEIAAQLHIEVSTVKSHLARISPRLGVRDRVQLVVWAYRSGLVR